MKHTGCWESDSLTLYLYFSIQILLVPINWYHWYSYLRVVNILNAREIANANRRVSQLEHPVIKVLSMILILGIFLTLM